MSIKTIWQKSAKKYVGTDISNLKIVDEQYQGAASLEANTMMCLANSSTVKL